MADPFEELLNLRDRMQTILDMTHDINDQYLREYIRREAEEALGETLKVSTPSAPAQP